VRGKNEDSLDARKVRGGADEDSDSIKVSGHQEEDLDSVRVRGGKEESLGSRKVRGGPNEEDSDSVMVRGGKEAALGSRKVRGGPNEEDSDSVRVLGGKKESLESREFRGEPGDDLDSQRVIGGAEEIEAGTRISSHGEDTEREGRIFSKGRGEESADSEAPSWMEEELAILTSGSSNEKTERLKSIGEDLSTQIQQFRESAEASGEASLSQMANILGRADEAFQRMSQESNSGEERALPGLARALDFCFTKVEELPEEVINAAPGLLPALNLAGGAVIRCLSPSNSAVMPPDLEEIAKRRFSRTDEWVIKPSGPKGELVRVIKDREPIAANSDQNSEIFSSRNDLGSEENRISGSNAGANEEVFRSKSGGLDPANKSDRARRPEDQRRLSRKEEWLIEPDSQSPEETRVVSGKNIDPTSRMKGSKKHLSRNEEWTISASPTEAEETTVVSGKNIDPASRMKGSKKHLSRNEEWTIGASPTEAEETTVVSGKDSTSSPIANKKRGSRPHQAGKEEWKISADTSETEEVTTISGKETPTKQELASARKRTAEKKRPIDKEWKIHSDSEGNEEGDNSNDEGKTSEGKKDRPTGKDEWNITASPIEPEDSVTISGNKASRESVGPSVGKRASKNHSSSEDEWKISASKEDPEAVTIISSEKSKQSNKEPSVIRKSSSGLPSLGQEEKWIFGDESEAEEEAAPHSLARSPAEIDPSADATSGRNGDTVNTEGESGEGLTAAPDREENDLPEIAGRLASILGIALGYSSLKFLTDLSISARVIFLKKRGAKIQEEKLSPLSRAALSPTDDFMEGAFEDTFWILEFLDAYFQNPNCDRSLDDFSMSAFESTMDEFRKSGHGPDVAISTRWHQYIDREPSNFALRTVAKVSLRADKAARGLISSQGKISA
jgi:hypothetical protein